MNTSRNFKIILIGCAAITMLTVLRVVTYHSPNPAYMQPDEVTHWNMWFTNDFYAKTNKWRVEFAKDSVHRIESNKFESVTIRYDLLGTNEMSMIEKMNMTLLELGLEKDESTVQRLVAARVAADWSKTPDSFRVAPDWAALQAVTLKSKIARLISTNDSLSIQRILEADIGPTVPPMADFEVREGPDAVWKEAEAMKQQTFRNGDLQ